MSFLTWIAHSIFNPTVIVRGKAHKQTRPATSSVESRHGDGETRRSAPSATVCAPTSPPPPFSPSPPLAGTQAAKLEAMAAAQKAPPVLSNVEGPDHGFLWLQAQLYNARSIVN